MAGFLDQITWGGTSGGSANAQTITVSNVAALAQVIGVVFRFIPGFTNTGAATLNINTLGAQQVKIYGAGLVGGEITIGVLACVVWDGSAFQLQPTAQGVTFTDSTHTATNATKLTITGAVIGGTSPDGTLTISASGAGFAGAIAPTSLYLGTASGRLFPYFYESATNTNTLGYDEGIGVVASLGTDSLAILRFPMPPTIPSGQLKLRLLALADATSGVAKVTVADGTCPAGTNPGAVSVTTETQVSQTWATADIYVEQKVNLSATPAGNNMLIVGITFNTSGWTLAAISVWIPTIIWQ